MQVSLRKASNIAKEMLKLATNTMRPPATASLSIYSKKPVTEFVAEHAAKADESVTNGLALIDAAYHVRSAIAAKNSESGVNEILTEIAALTAREQFVSNALLPTGTGYGRATTAITDLSIVQDIIATNIERMKTGYGSEEVVVAIRSEEKHAELKSVLSDIKKAKSDLNDKLTGLNAVNMVTLDADTVALIEKYKI